MKLRLLFIILFSFFISSAVFAQAPVNDDPCNATPLTAGTGCNYVTGTNLNATATTGVPAPGCANYVGGDVWFSVTVPASGSLIFDSNTGVVTDGGMAIYSGTCSNLTLISCNDDGSANGLMPSISANGLTPGSTIYIRFWEYGNDNNGDFSICVEQITPCATVSTNSSCASADPFCTGTSYDYCNTVNVPSLGGGGVYGCCLSTPNPAFYFMNIQSTGPITFNISQNTNAGVGIDVDFVLWGPFASQAAMCAGLSAGNIVDCSYSTAAVETATIPNANAGEWYMMLITNFSNQPGNIQFSQTNSNTAGSGATNCNILTAIPGPCTSGYFTLTGTVNVPGPPSTGILTITNSSGGTQVFNAPFSSSIAYSIPNICGDGNAHSVTAVFSAAGAPIVLPANYTAPSCNTLTATPGPCVSGQYTLSGTLTTNSCMPTTGTLTISSSCGGSVVYNAPFTSPLNWSLPPSNGNGGNCTIKAIYSATGAPTIDSIVISEPQCCGANAGTVTTTATNGTVSTSGSNTQVVLCPGGSVSLVSNNDYVLPPSYDPGWDDSELFYAIYLPPGPTVPDPDLDPNWTGYYWTGQDFTSATYATNSSSCGSPLLNLPGINATNNTLVFVPLTADDGDNGLNWDNVVAHDQNGDGCFDIGNPISITFLNPITFTSTATCSGSMSVQINGGYPEFLTGLYTITNTGSGTLSATSATAGGSVTISGLTTGQTYSINVTDAGGCVAVAYSGVYQGPPTISLTATPSTICLGSCSTLSATVNSGVTPGNATLSNKECAIIADGGIGTTNGTPAVNTGNWAHTCIEVSGVCDQTWNTGDVLAVTLNIAHTWDQDLDIYLQAPNGVYYLLSQDLGGGGDNYTNTVFSATGATVISGGAAAAPFTGTFKPLGAGNNFSSLNGTSINGSWCLWVGDDGAIDQGSIQDWSLTFANQTTVTYAWTPSTGLSATNIINPIACPTSSTSYSLTVTNACGCSSTATVPITVTPPVTPTFNPIGPICSGAVAPALPTTSTNGITGTWSPTTINNTTSGSYTFSPSAGQCADTIAISIVVDNAPILSSVITKPLCLGNSNGAIDLTVNGGTAPFTYQWSNGSTNQDLISLAVGTYTVTVSSANGCTAVLSNVVAAPLAVVASIASTTNIDCFGQSTGGITANGSGGTSPYTYLWSTGATTNVISNLPAGVYTITVTDANGCTNNTNVSATLLQQPQLTVSLPIVANVSCFGGNNGSITASPTGGTAGYNYSWSNGATGPTTSGLTIGSYTVTVTDSRGCTNTASTTITQPPQLAISIPSSTNVLCNGGATGVATALATSGTPVYTYLWSNGGNTAILNNLTAGTYVVTATDANGCSISTSATITQPTLLTATIPTTANVLCNGGSTGSATVSAIGGTTGYTYLWNIGSISSSIFNLTAGTYTVTATDANGCTSFTTTTITQPSALVVTIPITSNVLCNGGLTGSVTASASSGTPNYTYAWSTGATTTTISNLQVGTYTVTVTDANGCTNSTSTTLSQPAAIALTPSSTTSTCGQANGIAGVSVSGGVSSYSYLWSSGQTTASINNVASGGYIVTVTDANGCTSSTTANVGSIGGPTVTVAGANNVSCFGSTNGNAQVNVSSGTGPFIYNWLPFGGGSNTASNLSAGSYSVNVTDANGCTSSVSVLITQPTQLTLSIPSTTNVLCNGGATGSVTALAANGTSGYNYQWSTGATTATINNLTAGTYTVTATDANGCTTSTTSTISQPTLLTLSIPSTTNVLCNGGATGSATVLASNGTAGYAYQWNTGATTATINNLTVGSYTVTATDANGCTISTTATITQPTLLSLSIPSTTNVLCNGGATGSATALASNGTAGYSYLWSNGSTNAINNNLTAGTYTVTATDANGCTTSTTATITQPTLLTISIPSTTNVLCNGNATGSATALAANGTSGYAYQWNTGATTATINNLTAGSYTVTSTDANGCTTSTTATITQPSQLTLSILSTTNVLCNGAANGSITSLATNGTIGYNYNWSTGATSATVSNLTAGTYTVTATDGNGCTASTTAIVSQPTALAISIPSTTNVLCNGGATGNVTALASNGSVGYNYQWNTGATTSTINNLIAGVYTVTATDANGCTTSTTALVTQPSALTLSIPSTTNVLCNGGATGSATALAANGTPVYTYLWSNGGSIATVNNLTAGIYAITATDANGCTTSSTATISQPTPLTLSIPSTSNVLCNGGATGSASVSASGGAGSYTYLWSTGSTTSSVSNLAAGTYTVTATDANGCTTSTTAIITQPSLLTLSIPSTTNVLCNGESTGSATALAASGSPGYTYQWNTGATTSTINNLTVGVYAVTATDANGCTLSTIVSITQPSAIVLSTSSNPTLCGQANGSANVSAVGGNPAYTYSWSSGQTTSSISNIVSGGYVVTVTDGNGCTISTSVNVGSIGGPTVAITNNSDVSCFGGSNGSAQVNVSLGTGPFNYSWLPSGGTGVTASNLSAGSYTVNVTDNNGCTSSASVLISEPSLLTVSIPVTTNVLCNGGATGSATALAANGTSGYTYQWNTGATTATINNLTAGIYAVTATDANGCTTSTTASITQPTLLTISIPSTTNVLCNGGATGTATALASNGTSGYTYQWNTGATTATINNLTAGTYTVTATDANGCTTSTISSITQPTLLTLSIPSTTNVLCNGNATGSATALASNGTSGYTYQWSTGLTTATINNLTAGTYTVTATDANGCTTSTSTTITQPTLLTLSIPSTTNVLCNGGNTGSATALASNGTAGYTYQWNTGATTAAVNNLMAGTYTVTATDANGCTTSTTTNITQPSALTLSIPSTTNVLCNGGNTGSATAVASNGTAGYSYLWSNGSTNAINNNLTAGTYTITATDANGCTTSISTIITQPSALVLSIPATTNVICNGGSTGSASALAANGTSGYTYQWNTGATTATINNLPVGIYTVTATDANGCTTSTIATITQPSLLTISIPSTTNVLCNGGATGSVTALASNGTAGYSYLWSNGSTTAINNNLTAGIYTVTVTDANGCTTSTTASITQPTLLTISIPSTTNVLCNGGTTGSATALAANGTSGYTYQWNTGVTTAINNNLAAGTYTVTATDANGCTTSTTATISQPTLLTISIPSTTNVLCNGNATGSVTALAANGTSGYTYQWNTGATTPTMNNLTAGTYTVTATDANGCTSSTNTTITQPSAIILTGNSTSTLCGQLNGNASVSATGGIGAYSYLWSNGSTGSSINNVASGGYVVTVTDANGCSTNSAINVGSIGGPTVSIANSTDVSCFGGTNGSAQVNVSAGTGPYTYAWLPTGGSASTANNLTAGNYSVNVTDANGCTSSTTIVITQPSQLTITIPSTNNVFCNGGATGNATALASNGTLGYTYQWSTGATTATINNLTVGIYTVTATDANGCTTSTTATISQPTPLTISIPSTTNVLCNGGSTGSASALAANGTSGYTYQWNTGATTATINNLPVGIYTVTATDANGCTTSTIAMITQPSLLTISIPSTTNVLCNGGATGSTTALAANGTSGYTYQWNTGATSATINNLTAGTYTVTATDANGCTTSTTSIITQPTQLTLSIPSTTNVLCNGGATGSATALASNGTSGYTYQWNTGATIATINNLTVGTYTVTATDANGCSTSATSNINQPSALNLVTSSTASSCGQLNGSAAVVVTGGVAGYTYLWSGTQTTNAINNVLAGSYTVTVTDANGCSSSAIVNVNTIGGPAIAITSSNNVSCYGGSNGSAQVNINSGVGPFIYNWVPTGGTSQLANNLTAGNYSVNVTDANGCTNSANVVITQPTQINITPSSTASSCGQLNGSANVNVTGGVSGYLYNWSSGQTTSAINNIAAGTYTVTVTDGNGCTANSTVNVGTIGGPTVAISNSTNVSCFGGTNGSAQVNVSASVGPFTYAWLPTGGSSATAGNLTAGNYSVIVTDANGCTSTSSIVITQPTQVAVSIPSSNNVLCNGGATGSATALAANGTSGYTYQWNTGANTATINNLTAGTYTVTATDANGCTTNAITTIVQPNQLTIAIPSTTNVLCNGNATGSATAIAANGTSGYTYQWNNGATSSTINNLSAGTYTVTTTDLNSCTASASTIITEPTILNIQTSSTAATCGQLNGGAGVVVSGGVGSYTYLWSNGQSGNSINAVASGSYSITVTDFNGCTSNVFINIGSIGGPTVTIASYSDASCFGSANGSAQVNVSSGTGPFIYTWVPSGGNNASASNLTAGNYSVNVTDVNGCTSSTSVVISEPAVLTIAGSSTSSSCGQLNGTASTIVNGGVAGYSYLWSGGQTTSSISNVLSGIYSVTVTDANGCTANSSINVGSIGGPTVAISNSSNVTCFGGTNGTAQVNVSAGVGPYNYLWLPSGGNNASASNLTSGNYSVSVTDANGCTSSVSVVITQPSQVSVTIPSTTNVLCNGAATGSATALASNGTSGYTYQWNTGATSATINNLTAGIYTVTATDGNGCTISTTASIIQPTSLVVSIPSTTNVLCNGGATGSVTALASNGTSGYLYQWNTGATGAMINNLTGGTYTVTVTDANGCTITTNAIISQPTQLTVSIPSTTNVLCNGNATGSATALASNGTSGYTYQWNTGATNATINNLTVGTYTVTATDANGCTTTTTAFISQPTQLTVSILSTTNVLCNGGATGSATASASNGTSGYNYLWNNGAASAIASGLIAGTYTVTATDGNGCTTTTTAFISQPTLLTVSIPSTTNVLCNGNATGSATALATNGTAGYTYQWNNGASTATINNLTAGIYTVTATDANGCTSTINANITQPSALALTIPSSINILCYGGANGNATALASNGTAGYTYLWSNGSTSSTNNNLTAGVYTVTATDANGCSTFTSTTITQPNQLIAAIPNTTNVLCYGGTTGTATATASSGTANYSYLWSNGTTTALNSNLTSGNYTVTITDANGCTATATTLINQPTVLSLSNFNSQDVSCNGLSDGVASLSATGGTIPYVYSWNPSVSSSGFAGSLTAGNYSVVVTDANGCSFNHAFTITQPSAIVSNATITDASCHGSTNGSIAMNVNGGISPYSYNWSNGSTLSSSTGLATGNYTVTVTDAHGCTNLTTWSVNEPAALSSNVTNNDASCYGLSDGSIQVNMNGGTPSYQIVWTPSNTGFNLNNLSAGSYSAIVTDAHGCTHTLAKVINQPPQIIVNASTPNTLCIGQSQTLSLLVSGGSPAYTYLWSNLQTTSSITVTPSFTTNYSVTITDNNGCTATVNNLLVNVHPPLQLNIAANNDTICLGQSVSLSANASGGNGGPYTYNWNNGINTTSQVITPSSTGAYSVSVSDGCTTPNAQQALTIVVNPIPTPAFTPGNIQGCSPVSATFNLSSASGSGNTYLWSFGDNTTSTSVNPTHQYAGAGSYNVTLTVTNQYGCTGSVTNNNVVNVYALPIAKFTPDPSETQLLTANINFNNYSIGAAYYNWNFGDNATSTDFSPSHIYGDTGLYQVRLIASSLQQCRDTAYEYVHVVGSFTFWCPNAFSPNDDLKNDGFTGYGIGIKSATFVIFNRWGEKIYTSDNLANPWDGTFWNNGDRCPEDVYVYLFDVVSEDNEHHKYTGRVSLVK